MIYMASSNMYNVVYAKKGESPKNISFNSDKKLLKFLFEKLNSIDFISINDRNIDKEIFINNNIIMSRYFKLIELK